MRYSAKSNYLLLFMLPFSHLLKKYSKNKSFALLNEIPNTLKFSCQETKQPSTLLFLQIWKKPFLGNTTLTHPVLTTNMTKNLKKYFHDSTLLVQISYSNNFVMSLTGVKSSPYNLKKNVLVLINTSLINLYFFQYTFNFVTSFKWFSYLLLNTLTTNLKIVKQPSLLLYHNSPLSLSTKLINQEQKSL